MQKWSFFASEMKIIVTGSNGLIGSEAVRYFGSKGHDIIGVDSNLRKYFFGDGGDTTWNLKLLQSLPIRFSHRDIDIRDRNAVLELYKNERPDATIHCAAQPSHDLAAKIPFDDFDTNAVGTMNLLESNRLNCLDSPFVYMSTKCMEMLQMRLNLKNWIQGGNMMTPNMSMEFQKSVESINASTVCLVQVKQPQI